MSSLESVGTVLAEIANLITDGLRIFSLSDKRHWGPDEYEQVRALEDALNQAKKDFQALCPLVNGQAQYEHDRKCRHTEIGLAEGKSYTLKLTRHRCNDSRVKLYTEPIRRPRSIAQRLESIRRTDQSRVGARNTFAATGAASCAMSSSWAHLHIITRIVAKVSGRLPRSSSAKEHCGQANPRYDGEDGREEAIGRAGSLHTNWVI